MKKLLTAIKNLPPEMRMFLALMGLGTPIGAIYLLQRFLFPHTPTVFIIAGLLGVVVVVAGISFLVSKVMGGRSRKRARQMESELASTAESGLASMDVRAAIKENNEKFFRAIKEMKKNLGVNIYDLPWYIVIGDSGCGKTKLVNESGLIFAAGKPEGYQLGTLNYNWWFTEDAIFVDMAGRLCNPKDDGDYKEWQAFLNTVARGRKGYPINGALVCVSAEHLLQDPPEKHEQDANTALERLRDLQNKLGVTFATYLVVTKCDKILGFMQFFDRAERDITVKNQIFGWSKPGAFNELIDPEQFGQDFNRLYERLADLRLRRLNDDAEEVELGMACSFPEEFRELEAPLQTYMRTLFPMIKNPRAIKNLIFRGIYFTSATQQGSVILKHLSERLGHEAADMFPTLDSLYPRPRPLFVKDLLTRKVFPEHGLVFRNEDQVIRNRKLSKLMRIGSVALFAMLFGVLGLSAYKFYGTIGGPSERAVQSESKREAAQALHHAGLIGDDANNLEASFSAKILSLGVGYSQPVDDLRTIEVHLFETGVLTQALAEIDQALREKSDRLAPLYDGSRPSTKAREYMDALVEYVRWFSASRSTDRAAGVTGDSLKTMCAIVTKPQAIIVQGGASFTKLVDDYFGLVDAKKRNPATLMLSGRVKPEETITLAIAQVRDYLAGYAALTSKNPNPLIAEWMRILENAGQVEASYQKMIKVDPVNIRAQADYDAFKKSFPADFDVFDKAIQGLIVWKGPKNSQFLRISPLRKELFEQRKVWTEYEQRMQEALGSESTAKTAGLRESIGSLSRGPTGVLGLDKRLWDELKKASLTKKDYEDAFYKEEIFNGIVDEVDKRYGHIFGLVKAQQETESDQLKLSADAELVRGALKDITDRLLAVQANPSIEGPGATPEAWIRELRARLTTKKDDTKAPASFDFSKITAREPWQADRLAKLHQIIEGLIRRGEGTRLLAAISKRMGQTGNWGFGELSPGWRDAQKSNFKIDIPRAGEPVAVDKGKEAPKDAQPAAPTELVLPGDEPTSPKESRPRVVAPVETEQKGTGEVPNVATRAFMQDRSVECVNLMFLLARFNENFYFKTGDASQSQQCVDVTLAKWQAYMDEFFHAWSDAYRTKLLAELADLQRPERWSEGWSFFAAQFGPQGRRGGANQRTVMNEFQPALEEVLAVVRWAPYGKAGWWAQRGEQEWRNLDACVKKSWREQFQKVSFPFEAREVEDPANVNPPWVRVAALFARRWEELTGAIGADSQLPEGFDSDPLPGPPKPIPWGAINDLRMELHVEEDRITQQLVDFERNAQKLLNAELTNILVRLQEKTCGKEEPWEGWPYMNEKGIGLASLDTIDYESLKRLLLQADTARAVYQEFEARLAKGLKDDPDRQKRERFYAACQLWLKFIGADAKGPPPSLPVHVWFADPLGTDPQTKIKWPNREDIHDTAQLYYRFVELNLGLVPATTSEGAGKSGPLRIPTDKRSEQSAQHLLWTWGDNTAHRLDQLTMALTEGLPTRVGDVSSPLYPAISGQVLGKWSPLALPAYLHRYGQAVSGGLRYTSHAIDLKKAFEKYPDLVPKQRTRIGAGFLFRLDRSLPDPIAKLTAPRAVRTEAPSPAAK